MSLFKWAEEDSKGSPLFAAALGGAAASTRPLAKYINSKVLGPSLAGIDRAVVDSAGELTVDQIKALKGQMIDKSIRNKLLVLPDRKGPALVLANKNYLPPRAVVERLLNSGGLRTLEGAVDPIRAVKAIREVGGHVAMPTHGANAITLAHELGHATSFNPETTIRSSKPYRYLDSMGRRLANSGSRSALAAAILAGSFKSDDNSKWVVPAAIAATQAPMLAEEATASFKAMDALNALKNRPSNTVGVVGESNRLLGPAILENAGKSLRRAFGTYGLASAGLLAAPLLAIKARSEWDDYTGN
jgi:hypothetical protein